MEIAGTILFDPIVPPAVAEILSTHTPALFEAAVARAAELLRQGDVVALPTETVYGLAANALDPSAVARVYALKGRPSHNPIIVHVNSGRMARTLSVDWTSLAEKLAAEFWPGPLTLVVLRSPAIPDIVTASGPTVGLRFPSHPFMPAVIQATGLPLAAPSANLANQLSPTCARHVAGQLGDQIPLIIDGGDSNVGIESTVVDVTGRYPRILRPGIISAEMIARVLGNDWPQANEITKPPGPPHVDSGPFRSPGQLQRHYAPRARMVVWHWHDEADLHRKLAGESVPPDRTFVIAYRQIPLSGRLPHVQVIPDDAEAYARALYGQLHACDAAGAQLIVVEGPPDTSGWEGIRDRLRRGAAPE